MKPSRILTISVAGIICLVICFFLSVSFGVRSVGLHDILTALFSSEGIGDISIAVVRERIPRTVFSLAAGAALGASGCLMQAITRNPIADPSILGVNTGASLFVVCGVAFFGISTAGQYIWFAMAGAGVTAVFVYTVGSLGYGGATPIKLALAGAATSAALSSLVSAVMLPRTEVMNVFRFWQVGSVSGADWEGIFTVLPFLVCGLAAGLLCAPALNILALGDDAAASLGVRTGLVRIVGAFAGVILCGATTALAGPIGFVGLMVPHVMRMPAGPDQRVLLPLSAVGGAIVLTVSDVVGRLLGGTSEVEAGLVTAFLGAPLLIFIVRRSKVGAL